MGLFKDDAGKTEKPTPQRLQESRQKGQTAISKEFTMAGTLIIALLALDVLGPWLIGSFRLLMENGMALQGQFLDGGDIGPITARIVDKMWIILPPFATLLVIFFVATLLFGYGQIGIKVSKKVLGFKFERLNPAKGVSKLFKMSQVVKTVFSAFKLLILGSVLWFVLQDSWGTFAVMHDLDFVEAIGVIAMLAMRVFFWVAVAVLVLSIGDIVWQRYDFYQNQKMTKQEVDDERKRTDGDPLVKSRLRQARMEFMRQRMMEAIPEADVVITNPTHYSVALRYNRTTDPAPRVVAKGVDDLALRIRELAGEHDVPLMEDPPLARALYRAVKVGTEVPEKFYQAVAAVLSHVYRLRGQVA